MKRSVGLKRGHIRRWGLELVGGAYNPAHGYWVPKDLMRAFDAPDAADLDDSYEVEMVLSEDSAADFTMHAGREVSGWTGKALRGRIRRRD